ncbi:MAG TPA: IS4 family transposase [Acetobacteraceae bacterium]|nr:IS4 family transposase [Acetobacteraceae bacterium]
MPTPAAEYPVTVSQECAQSFVAHYLGAVDLGHRSRNRCFARVAERISRHPGGSLPDKLSNPAAYAAMDRLMNRPETTHAAILAAHRQQALAKMRAGAAVVLLLHDTTVLDYSGRKSLGLAPVGNGHGRGYLCHNTLAVDPANRQVFGLLSQLLHRRVAVGRREGVRAKRQRPTRESRLWSRAVLDLPPAPADQRWVDVADRGADLFEFLATEQRLGRRCVVRSAHNRSIQIGHGGRGVRTLLHDYLRALPAAGAARDRQTYDPQLGQERRARLRVAYAAVTILPPHVRKGEYDRRPILAWAVRVWEEAPPAKGAKLEWFLVCLDPVTTAADAWQKSDWYGCRWMVEEYHKAQKTGCQVEGLQFRTTAALEPMIALLSVVAVMLLNLRQAARRPDAQTRPASAVVEPIYEEVLRAWRYPQARAEMTIYEFYLAVARLGGHMNRKRDGFPGWLTLWRGWQKLESMVAGAHIGHQRRKKIV